MSSVTCSELYLVDGQIDAIYSDLSSLECSKSRLGFYGVQGVQVCAVHAQGL